MEENPPKKLLGYGRFRTFFTGRFGSSLLHVSKIDSVDVCGGDCLVFFAAECPGEGMTFLSCSGPSNSKDPRRCFDFSETDKKGLPKQQLPQYLHEQHFPSLNKK